MTMPQGDYSVNTYPVRGSSGKNDPVPLDNRPRPNLGDVIRPQETPVLSLPQYWGSNQDAYHVYLPSWGNFHAKTERGVPGTFYDSVAHHVDSYLPQMRGGKAGAEQETLVPRTYSYATPHDLPSPAGHPVPQGIPGGHVVSLSDFQQGALPWRQARILGLAPDWHQDLVRMSYLDHLMGNTDRHDGNFLFTPGKGTLHAIDHETIPWAPTSASQLSQSFGGYGNYLKERGRMHVLNDPGAMAHFLDMSSSYAEKAGSRLGDSTLYDTAQRTAALVNTNQEFRRHYEPSYPTQMLYDSLRRNRDDIPTLIQNHRRSL